MCRVCIHVHQGYENLNVPELAINFIRKKDYHLDISSFELNICSRAPFLLLQVSLPMAEPGLWVLTGSAATLHCSPTQRSLRQSREARPASV